LRWLLILEEYGLKFDYLPEKKQKNVVADALSHLDINSLKIQEDIEEISQDQKPTASIISYVQAQCILP
jgi:hypothetical protein